MKITHFYTKDGRSHFEDIELPTDNAVTDKFGHTAHSSRINASPGFLFTELPATLKQDWHNAPTRQLVIVLAGEMEISVADNETRRWKAGEMFFADDVTGKGHLTRTVNGPVRVVAIRLPESFDIAKWSA